MWEFSESWSKAKILTLKTNQGSLRGLIHNGFWIIYHYFLINFFLHIPSFVLFCLLPPVWCCSLLFLSLLGMTSLKKWKSCLAWRTRTSSGCWECVWAVIPSVWSLSTWNVEIWTSICPTECFWTRRGLHTTAPPSGKNKRTLFCTHLQIYVHALFIIPSACHLPPQLPSPDFHGQSDCIRNEVSLLSQFCASRSGHTKLPSRGWEGWERRGSRRRAPHQDSWLWHEQKLVCWRLLQNPRQSCAANTMDGMGVYPHGEECVQNLIYFLTFTAWSHTSALIMTCTHCGITLKSFSTVRTRSYIQTGRTFSPRPVDFMSQTMESR